MTKPLGIPGNWTLKFEDTFREAALDQTKWTPGWWPDANGLSDPVNTYELGGYDAKLVSTGINGLRLRALNQPMVAPPPHQKTMPYRSGLISSNGKFEFTYGVAEAVVKLPLTSTGLIANWPAFWTVGHNWPYDGEIDIMEGLAGVTAWHVHTESMEPGGNYPEPQSGWHTYSVHWEPGKVSFYFRGLKVAEQPYPKSDPNFLVVNHSIPGPQIAPSNQIVTPADMYVGYVRVWQ